MEASEDSLVTAYLYFYLYCEAKIKIQISAFPPCFLYFYLRIIKIKKAGSKGGAGIRPKGERERRLARIALKE